MTPRKSKKARRSRRAFTIRIRLLRFLGLLDAELGSAFLRLFRVKLLVLLLDAVSQDDAGDEQAALYSTSNAANMSSMVIGEASGVAIAETTMSTTYTVRQLPRSFLYGRCRR